jgi:pimeloyl-ACP methyl ester carboxylesterase
MVDLSKLPFTPREPCTAHTKGLRIGWPRLSGILARRGLARANTENRVFAYSHWYNRNPAKRLSLPSTIVSPERDHLANRSETTMTKTYGFAAALAVIAVAIAAGTAGAEPAEDSGHGFAPVGGTRLFYEAKGSGAAVVLIHGGQLDCRMWDDQFTVLAKQFRVIRYDVRGYGGSLRPEVPYSDADDLAALLEYLKLNKVHIVGLSLGGRIAIDFTVAHPTRVNSLALAGPGLSGYEPPGGAQSDLRMWNIIKAARDDGPEKATALWLKDPFMAPAMEQTRLMPGLQRIARENAHCWLENPILNRPPKPETATRLGEIKVPTLLVIGDRDVPQIKATIGKLEKEIAGSKKVAIKDAGHMVNMEKPEIFNATVLRFLREQ